MCHSLWRKATTAACTSCSPSKQVCLPYLQLVTEAAERQEDVAGGTVYVGSAGIALLYIKIWQKLKAGAVLPNGLQYITPQRALLKVLSICEAAAPHIAARKVRRRSLLQLTAPPAVQHISCSSHS